MSSQTDKDDAQILAASVHDVRYFASLLRGVNIGNRATVNISEAGLTISVEEARTLLGTAFIFRDIFDDFSYDPDAVTPSQNPQRESEDEDDSEQRNSAFEIPLNTVIECLNVFGTASGAAANAPTKYRRWRRDGDSDRDERNDNDVAGQSNRSRSKASKAPSNNSLIDHFFGSEKGTGMRMSYAGPGYPLTMVIAEDSDGPTAACEITTFEAEPHLELPFDTTDTILKIILKSSWLRDALSELDPSCEKLTIIGNPPPPPGKATRTSSQPRLRLKAVGTFGSTEMDYPNDKEVLETCECDQVVSFSYRFSHIAKALRALQTSTKTSLRINEEGLLSLQFLMPSPKPRGSGGDASAFVEFRCLALDETT